MVDQLRLWTLEEAEAMAEKRALEARDKAVRFLQYEVREGREASGAGVGTQSGSGKLQ